MILRRACDIPSSLQVLRTRERLSELALCELRSTGMKRSPERVSWGTVRYSQAAWADAQAQRACSKTAPAY